MSEPSTRRSRPPGRAPTCHTAAMRLSPFTMTRPTLPKGDAKVAGPPLTTDERAAGLNAVTYAFLGSSPLNETLDVSVDQHPELNVQLTKTRRGLRMIVAQKKEGSP